MKALFETPRRMVISVICIAVVIVVLGGVAAVTVRGASGISLEKAEEIAYADAGVSASEIMQVKTKSDFEDGVSVYEIEFYTDRMKYEYEVTANKGVIYSKSREMLANQKTAGNEPQQNVNTQNEDQQNTDPRGGAQQTKQNVGTQGEAQQSTGEQISLETAKSAAIADAGLSVTDVTFTKEKLDYEDGIAVYDIEFYTSTQEYEYEINAITGAVYSKDTETYNTRAGYAGHDIHDEHEGHHGYIAGSTAYIGEDKAKSIVVEHAGFVITDVNFSKIELDSDDGQIVYEIEFYKDGREYEYTINASTGSIIEYDVD